MRMHQSVWEIFHSFSALANRIKIQILPTTMFLDPPCKIVPKKNWGHLAPRTAR